MKDYDVYLFDLDGTIASTLDMWIGIMRYTLGAYGIDMGDRDIMRKIMGRAQTGLLELGLPKKDAKRIYAEWVESAKRQLPSVALYPGAPELLDALRQHGKKLALITAGAKPIVQKLLEAQRLADTFEAVVTGDQTKADKPHPEGINLALAKLGVNKDRAVMLGDSEKDIQAAHNAGIDSVLFYPPEHKLSHPLEELQAFRPTYTINSWQDLIDNI